MGSESRSRISMLAESYGERVVPTFTFEGIEVPDSVAGQLANDPRFSIESAKKGEFGLDQGTTVLDFRVGATDPEEHLQKALEHAEMAEEGFEDESREERLANNAVRWTRKAVSIIQNDE